MNKTTSSLAAILLVFLFAATSFAEQPSPAPEGTFSFVVLPDTQAYVSKEKAIYFESEVNWILDNRKSQRIKFVSHVGDIVGTYESDAHWKVARKNMLRLLGQVPFGFSVGNHDMQSSGDSRKFQKAFPASLFAVSPWFGGQIKINANSFQLISVNGMEFLVLHLEGNAPDEVLKWADSVLEKHAGRRAMITTHMYLGPVSYTHLTLPTSDLV